MVSTLAAFLTSSSSGFNLRPTSAVRHHRTNVLEEDDHGRRDFRFVEGPVFSTSSADEINRTPPRLRPRCCKPCKSTSDGGQRLTRCRSVFSPSHAEPDRQEGRIRCRKRSWTASCSTSRSIILRWRKRNGYWRPPPAASGRRFARCFPAKRFSTSSVGSTRCGERVHHTIRIATGAGHAPKEPLGAKVHPKSWSTGPRPRSGQFSHPKAAKSLAAMAPVSRGIEDVPRRSPYRLAAPHQHEFSGPARGIEQTDKHRYFQV